MNLLNNELKTLSTLEFGSEAIGIYRPKLHSTSYLSFTLDVSNISLKMLLPPRWDEVKLLNKIK
jgi:hypothetical protein